MNYKAQTAIAFIMALVGAGVAFLMADRMGAGIAYKVITAGLTGVACYGIVWWMAQQG